jgi:hypothetical protein
VKLTPLQINAASGLLDNKGLCANTQQKSGQEIYLSSPLIKPLIETIEIGSNNGSLATSTITSLSSLSPVCPALSNSGGNVAVIAASGPNLYSTLGVTSLNGKMISNVIRAGTTVNCGDASCSVNMCQYQTPSGDFTNLVDPNTATRYTSFDVLSCYKTTTSKTENGVFYPFLMADFVEYPKDGNVANVPWLGKCWAQDKDYDKFEGKLHNLYLGAGGTQDPDTTDKSKLSYDYTIFVQAYNLIQGYIQQANQFIDAANIGQDYLSTTFNGMSDLISGSISSINPNIKGFSTDLRNLGKLINMDDLESLGSPLALVRQIINVAGYLPVLSLSFLTVGIPQHTVGTIGSPSANVSDETQRLMYDGLKLITGDALSQVLKVLQVKTENLSSAADLLDPAKIFPNSYSTLKVPTADGYVSVYSGSGVNTVLKNSLPPYILRSTA